MKHIQINRKSIGKSIPAYGFSHEKNPRTKSLETFAKNVCDFQKRKPYRLR
jgi:hypothetical protein